MIGKPFVNTISESNRLSQIVREITANRNTQPSSQDSSTADDFYNVVQTSYDASLIDKGLCSSTLVNVSVIPFTKLTQENNAEADILNIQRNLDTIAISNVNEIINNLTGTLSSNVNASLDDRQQIDAFRSATLKLTSAYNAKAAYMTHLASPYAIETNSDFDNSYGTGDVPEKILTVKNTSFEEKTDWIESYLNLESASLKSGYNIKNLLQIVRNSFARKVYGSSFFVTGSSDSLYIRRINADVFNAALDSYFGNLTNVYDSSLNISDENTDLLITADSKAVAYTRAGINFESSASTFVGDLVAFSSGFNLSKLTNVGAFSSLLQYQDSNKTVLPLDVNVGDQKKLESYESADEFFLGLPLVDNKENLPARRDKFASDSAVIESETISNMSNLILQNDADLYSLNSFLSQMRTMMQESFYTTNSQTSIMRFVLLMTALNDTQTRRRIFNIMMLRDRLINSLDYVSSSGKSSFESKARVELESAVFNLIKYLIPVYSEPVPLIPYDKNASKKTNEGNASRTKNLKIAQDDEIFETLKSVFEWTPSGSGGAYFNDNVPIEFTFIGDYTVCRDMLDALVTDLNDPASHQWDNFFKAARNVEAGSNRFLKTSPTASGSDVLLYKVGTTSTLTRLTRDDRAFLFFNKWLSIISDLPFKIEFDIRRVRYYSDESADSYLETKVYYSSSLYEDLKNALSLTLSSFTPEQFSYYFEYVQPLARGILQDTQSFYDGIDYVYRFIMQASSLLNDASNIAYSYTSTFGENLSNHYTSNAILNLNRQAKLSFSRDATYQNFSKDQYKNSNVLNGFLRYIQDDAEISGVQDSFIVVCGIPYGMLDRLGAFNQNNIGYVDVTVTLRPIGGSETGDIEIIKSYPIGAYVEHQYLTYDSTTNASYQQILDSTSLYELNSNLLLTVNDQFDEKSKQNELQSTALLNYIQLFYGLTFDYNITNQIVLNNITNSNTTAAIDAFKEKVYRYRFDELVESRYISTGVNSLRFSRSNIITKALGGGVFDKVVAIPIDASLLKGAKAGYLVDILVSVDARFVERVVPVVTRTITEAGSNLVANLQSTIKQSVTSTINAAANFNIRGRS